MPDWAVEALGWMAGGFTLVAFTMRTMVPLRVAALCSNVCFVAWAALEGLAPVLALHAALLPFNVLRLWQIRQLDRKVRAARHGQLTAEMLMPFARRRAVRDGEILFRAGDPADDLYFIVSGRMRVEPAGVELGPGALVGEIAFFSRERQRTQSVRAAGAGLLLALDEAALLRLYHENPTFSFRIAQIITTRLVDDVRALRDTAHAHAHGHAHAHAHTHARDGDRAHSRARAGCGGAGNGGEDA